MPVPVIIAARNEEAFLGTTLAALSKHDVTPIVVANGCYDNTVVVAKEYNPDLIELEEASKVAAIQAGIKHLGRDALQPFMMIDADSQPLSSQWINRMAACIDPEAQGPAIVTGPSVITHGPDFMSDIVHTVRRYAKMVQAKHKGTSIPFGINSMMYPRYQRVIDLILEMPDYWPGEDQAFRDLVLEAGGHEYQSIHPLAAVVTSGRRGTSLATRLRFGKVYTTQHLMDSYSYDSPPNAVMYPNWQYPKRSLRQS